jgi:hypothetical protein
MKSITTILLLAFVLTGCAGSGGGSSAALSTPSTPSVALPNGNSGSQSPTGPQVTYYTNSVTTTVSGVGTYTAQAACVVYNSNTYCWDDSIHTLSVHNGGSFDYFHFTYFGLDDASGLSQCSGDCNVDPFTQPRLIDSDITNLVGVNAVSEVFSQGTPTTVNCTLSGNQLNCVDFTVNLSQVAL